MIVQKRSKTNSGLINLFEKIIRHHPLVYYIARNFIRYTNIFEEDANGVSYLNFDKKVNIIDVGASDGIATKFFCKKLNVNKIYCFEPNDSYVEILKKSNIKNLIVKPYAIGNKNTYKKIYFPRYKFFSKNLDLIPYTYYDKKTLLKQIQLDFKHNNNLKIVEKNLKIKKIDKINSKIDFVKVDVNDNGLSVIKCLNKIIYRDKPAVLIETDFDIYQVAKELKKYGYEKFSFSNSRKKFSKIKNKYPLNTYFLQKKHLLK